MGTSIWPNDIYNTPAPTLDKKSLGSVRCFLACPFAPKERWDDILSQVTDVCALVGQAIGIDVQFFRADSIISSGVIHPEIWEALRSSDIIVVDVSGQNGIVGSHSKYNSEDAPVIGRIGAYAGIVNWASGKHFVT